MRNFDIKRAARHGLERDREKQNESVSKVDLRAAASGSEKYLEHVEVLKAELGEDDGGRSDSGG